MRLFDWHCRCCLPRPRQRQPPSWTPSTRWRWRARGRQQPSTGPSASSTPASGRGAHRAARLWARAAPQSTHALPRCGCWAWLGKQGGGPSAQSLLQRAGPAAAAGHMWRCGERCTRIPSAARRCSARSTPRGELVALVPGCGRTYAGRWLPWYCAALLRAAMQVATVHGACP